MSLQAVDQLYFWSGIISGASDAYNDKFVPALVLTLSTGALATSLRSRLFEKHKGEPGINRTINAICHTVVDALHLGSGLVTGALLATSGGLWNAGRRYEAVAGMTFCLASVLATSCAAVFARTMANKTNPEKVI